MTQPRLCAIAVSCAIAGVLLAPGPARAQDDTLDCVMEPRSTIELGSPEEGILAEVLVDRGDRVEKNVLVAKLDAGLERLTAELARLRAEADADIRSGRAQVEFRRKEVVRLELSNPGFALPAGVRCTVRFLQSASPDADVRPRTFSYEMRAGRIPLAQR